MTLHTIKDWRAWAAFSLLVAMGCGAVQIPRATQADLKRATEVRPETTLAELEQGRSLYLSRCTSCHQPLAPASILATKWPGYVAEMQERAHLDTEQAKLVVLYLVTMTKTSNRRSSQIAVPLSPANVGARTLSRR